MRVRHNLKWYASLGAGFYEKASTLGKDPGRAKMMGAMAENFGFWRRQQSKLARDLRELPKLVFRRDAADSSG